MSVERSRQMSAQDTLRWGDVQSFAITTASQVHEPQLLQSKQLINARWRWPMTWKLMFVVNAQLGPAETGTITVQFQLTTGVGGATIVFILDTVTITTSGTTVHFFDMPAQEFNVTTVVTIANIATTGTDVVEIGAFAGPWTESHAVTGMHDTITEGEERVDQWMREGFYPEPLGYHR
jgi:hypothetical protein